MSSSLLKPQKLAPKKINTTQHKRSKQKKKPNFQTRCDHNKDCEDLCKNRKIDETQKQPWRKQGPKTTLLASRCVENGIYRRATTLPHQIFVSSDGHGTDTRLARSRLPIRFCLILFQILTRQLSHMNPTTDFL